MNAAIIILGNQLFEPALLKEYSSSLVFMREDLELCRHFKYHKLKISLFLNAMRSYADELKTAGFQVSYQKLTDSNEPYEKHLSKFLSAQKVEKVILFEIEDKFFETRVLALFKASGLEVKLLPSPMFLTSREQFESYLSNVKKPFMRTFYEKQRRRLKVMIDEEGEPIGGRWSFDELNRKPLPAKLEPPTPLIKLTHPHAKDVSALCEKHFKDHPGATSQPWFATDRQGAHEWLQKFLEERFALFGPYEDALAQNSDFVFHSVLTPYLNIGLLSPADVLREAIRIANKKKLNIASVEGFVRQIIGWREFVRGIYQNYSETQDTANFFDHHRGLTKDWYEGTTGVKPLDFVIQKTLKYGYAHHIERLMVVGNLMLLCEVRPNEVHRWFMEMFIDSSDWVMGPNVYGMAIFSDGGIFATKPYICGSNYYRKMGGYKKAEWCEGVDGLYWGFVWKHRNFFLKNPRLSMMVRTYEKMDDEKKKTLSSAAKELKDRITTAEAKRHG